MRGSPKASIRKRLTGLILSIITFVTLLAYAIFALWYYHDQKQQSIEEARTVSYVIAQDLAKLILLNNISVASDISAKLDSFPFLNWLVLYKKDGTPIYQYSKSHQNFDVPPLHKEALPQMHEKSVTHTLQATYQGRYLGNILMDIKVKTIGEILSSHMIWFLLFYLLMIFVSYMLASYYAKRFTQPIVKLVDFLTTIDLSKASGKRIRLGDEKEFFILEEKVNTMLDRLEHSLAQQRIASVAFETPSGMIITDAQKRVIQVNQAYTEITGYTQDEVIGKKPPVLRCEVEDSSLYETIERALHEQHYWAGEIKNCKKDGSAFTEYLSIQEVYDNEIGAVTHYVFSFIDLSIQKEVENRVAYLMQYDPLTGLANKSLLLKKLEETLTQTLANEWHAMIGFDIKDFKMINDAYGYEVGDRILQEITARLKDAFSDSSLIAKIGIDEFILCYRSLSPKKEEAVMQVQMIAEYLHSIISKTFLIGGNAIHLSIQVGINLYDASQKNADVILKNTDAALQIAKKKEEKIAFFNKEIEVQVKDHVDLYTDLQIALQHGSFELYYQPQYDREEKICGAEALIRWHHPQRGLVSPVDFISIAEKSGLIIDIGKWVLHEACQQIAQWRDAGLFTSLPVSVNVSAKQFAAYDFVQQVQHAVITNRIPYHLLKLELVESVLLIDHEHTIQKMELLRRLGVRISMDDFGTGYSSLEYLKVLPLDQIKIDRSFIMHMHTSKKDLAIVKTMISLAEAFEFEVVAEGVEHEEDVALLKALGCHVYQGYYYAKPVPVKEFNKFSVSD